MAVNKNFVVKNGLEVFSDLIFADTITDSVGFGTVTPTAKVEVNGDIKGTDLVISGISTLGTVSNLNVSGVSTFQGNVNLGDNDRLRLGDDNDLQIYHSGTNSIIETTTGSLFIRDNGNNVYIQGNSGESSGTFRGNGAVELYYNNSKKFETISTGATVTGDLYATTIYGDGTNITGISAETIGPNANVNTTGIITASAFYGDGSNLTGISADTISTDANINTTGIITASSFVGDLTGSASNVNVSDESSDTSCFPLFVTQASGDLSVKTGSNLTFNSSNGTLTATSFGGNGSALTSLNASNITTGTISDSRLPGVISSDITGNAATATNATNATTATNANNINVADESSDSTCFPVFTTTATGNQAPKTDSSALTYNASNGTLSATELNSTSDINLKKDIEVITNATELLGQIRGVKFSWKESDKKSTGVIAQDVEKVLPELISERSDNGTKSVNYNGLVGVLIEAVKELSARVEELENK